MVIAGTGSNVAGQKSADEPIEKVGGWGHLFSDEGSAYDIARVGLQEAYATYDATRKTSVLAQEFLTATGKNSMEELVPLLLKDNEQDDGRSIFAMRFYRRAKRRYGCGSRAGLAGNGAGGKCDRRLATDDEIYKTKCGFNGWAF